MSPTIDWRKVRLHTLGHSTRSLDELVLLLSAFGITLLADIRTIPRSRHNPQFNLETLPSALEARGVTYAHLPELGGLRRTVPGSPNGGFRNASFRGYADHMQTPEFAAGLAKLGELTRQGEVALMCAEAVPWRCHRSLVADALLVRGAHVEHIMGKDRATPHHLTKFAQVHGTLLTYPEEPRAADPRGD